MTTAQHNNSTAPDTARKPLRFCMVTTFYPPYNFGGDGIFVARLTHALAERGHHVTVVHCADAYRLGGGTLPEDSTAHPPNVEVHTISSAAGALSPLVTHQFATPGLKSHALHEILDGGTFDVIHFHNVSLIGGAGVLAYGNAVKLYTAHEYWLVCPLSTLWRMQEQPCEKKACVSCTLDARKPPQWWRYSRKLERELKHIDIMISPSRFGIRKHADMGLDANFVHLPNFLPLKKGHSHRAAAHIALDERPFYLYAGRLEKSKGVHELIEAFKRFDAADLIIVGSGPFEANLRQQASGLSHVRFAGYVDYGTLCGLYCSALATVVPSIWYEPFGLIVIESFAQGTPVIVNNAGALPELVEQSGGGLVYNSTEQLQNQLKQLFSDTELAAKLGDAGRASYLKYWTEEQHLAQYFALIDDKISHSSVG